MIVFVLPYPWDGAPQRRPHASAFMFEAVTASAPAAAFNVLSWEWFRRFPTSVRHFWTHAPLHNLLLLHGPSSRRHGDELGRALRHRVRPPGWMVWSDPAHVDALAHLPGWRHLYYCTDDFIAARGPRAAEQERRMVGRCEAVVAVSRTLARRLAPARLIPNGVDPAEAFAHPPPHPQLADIPAPRVVYVGHLNERVDVDLLAAFANRGSGSLLLVGPRLSPDPRWDALCATPGVYPLGYRDRAEVRAILAGASVGLIPYRMSNFNLACSPLKLHEYVGAGLRVVSTALPAVESQPPAVWLAGRETEFVERIEESMHLPRLPLALRRAHVDANAWSRRAADLLETLPSLARVG